MLEALLLVAGLTLALLLIGFPASLGHARFITVDGRPMAVTPGTTLAQLAEARGIIPRDGALVDIAGDVLVPSGGGKGTLEVDGKPAGATTPLPDGSALVARRGRDVSEKLDRHLAPIPNGTKSAGRGPVLTLVRKGSPGTKETFVGTVSRRTAAVFVVRPPVDALLRRSSGLSAGQRAVALTFDDGPSAYTTSILAVLQAKRAPGTFFVIGRQAAGRPDLIARLRAAGQEVENHTWSHADLTKLDAQGVRSEITRAAQAIGGAKFLRPPYGAYNGSVAEEAGALGLRLVLWDVDTLDWKTRNAAKITAAVKAAVRPGAIILMHDGGGDRSQTAAALPGIIDWLLEQGYALTTVSTLVGP